MEARIKGADSTSLSRIKGMNSFGIFGSRWRVKLISLINAVKFTA